MKSNAFFLRILCIIVIIGLIVGIVFGYFKVQDLKKQIEDNKKTYAQYEIDLDKTKAETKNYINGEVIKPDENLKTLIKGQIDLRKSVNGHKEINASEASGALSMISDLEDINAKNLDKILEKNVWTKNNKVTFQNLTILNYPKKSFDVLIELKEGKKVYGYAMSEFDPFTSKFKNVKVFYTEYGKKAEKKVVKELAENKKKLEEKIKANKKVEKHKQKKVSKKLVKKIKKGDK